jgi:hypothetical protein
VASFVIPVRVVSVPSIVIALRPSGFRDELDRWVRDQGFGTFVTDEGRAAVEWVRRAPRTVSFLDLDLERVDGEEVWRLARRIARAPSDGYAARGRSPGGPFPGDHRLVLMAARRTNELWFTALAEGVGSLLPLPTERDVVLTALRVAGRF